MVLCHQQVRMILAHLLGQVVRADQEVQWIQYYLLLLADLRDLFLQAGLENQIGLGHLKAQVGRDFHLILLDQGIRRNP